MSKHPWVLPGCFLGASFCNIILRFMHRIFQMRLDKNLSENVTKTLTVLSLSFYFSRLLSYTMYVISLSEWIDKLILLISFTTKEWNKWVQGKRSGFSALPFSLVMKEIVRSEGCLGNHLVYFFIKLST